MNLHGLAAGAIGAVNPFVPSAIKVSTGYTTDAAGTRTPTFSTVPGIAQVQALGFMDLKQIDGLNLNGTRRKIYFYGQFQGTNRPAQKGGDIVTLTDGPNAGDWLVAMVTEQWPDWCSLIATQQKPGA